MTGGRAPGERTTGWERAERRPWAGRAWKIAAAAVVLALVAGAVLGGDEEGGVAAGDPDDLAVDEGEARDGGGAEGGAEEPEPALADGSRWTVHADPDRVSAVAPAPTGGLWAGTEAAGLVRWEPGDGYERHRVPEFAGHEVVALEVGDDLSVWAAARGTPGVHRYVGDEWYHYTTEDGLPHEKVHSLAAADGVLWAGTSGGLVRFDGRRWTTFDDELPHPVVGSVAVDADGAVWAATGGTSPYGGLVRFDGDGWRTWRRGEDLSQARVVEMTAGADGDVWIVLREPSATSADEPDAHRLWRIVDGEPTVVAGEDAFPEGRVRAFAVDADGTPWAVVHRPSGPRDPTATGSRVLRRFDGSAWRPAPGSEQRPDSARALTADAGGRVWAATSTGIARYADGEWRRRATGEGPSGAEMTAVTLGGDGAVWATAAPSWAPRPDAGLEPAAVSRFDGERWATWRADDPVDAAALSSIAVGADDTAWVVTEPGPTSEPSPEPSPESAVWRLADGEWAVSATAPELGHDRVSEVAAGGGAVWALVADAEEADDAPEPPEGVEDPPDPPAFVRLEWDAGLARFDGEEWTTWTGGPLEGRSARSLVVDADGAAWVRLAPPSHPRPRDGPARGGAVVRFDGDDWERFGDDDGLPSDHVTALGAGEHAVWAASTAGVARFDGERWVEPAGDAPFEADPAHLVVGDAGTVWAATWKAVVRFDGSWTAVDADDVPVGHVQGVAAGDEAVWFATAAGLARFELED